MIERERGVEHLSDAELEAQAGEELPDRKAMSAVNGDPSELGIVAIDELPTRPKQPSSNCRGLPSSRRLQRRQLSAICGF